MAEIALAAVQTVLAALVFLEMKGIRSFWDYKSQIKDLKNTVDFIKCSLEDLQFKVLTKEGEHFTRQLKYVIYEADDLFDEFVTLLKTGKLSDSDTFFDKVSSYFSYKALKMFNKVKKIRKKLDDIAANHHKFATVREYEPISFRGAETCSHIDSKDLIIGRDKDKEAILLGKLLGSNNQNVDFFTIVGVGGLGKTALAQLVYNDEKLKQEFGNFMFWVCVSDQFDVKAILCEILELVMGERYYNSTKEVVGKKFRENLGGKKYFIVLDDVWNEDLMDWLDLQRSLLVGQGGSRILVTTRSERTANLIEDGQTYQLQGLSTEDSWQLFKMTAFKKDTNQQSREKMVEIGKKIVQKCSNIPLAIRVVGSLLYGQNIGRWESFEHKELVEINNGDNKVMSVLKLSYHKLSWSLKTCFSYCAVFPKDLKIQKEFLINFWMACGCIEPFHGRQTIEEAVEEHFEILLQRCFFQDVEKNEYDEIESFKIHDLMHDVAQEVGGEFQVLGSVDDTLEYKTRHVSVNDVNCLVQSSSNLSNLRTLLIPDICTQVMVAAHYNETKGKVGNCKSLRVLQLRYLYRGSSLNSIVKLLHLRYLDLSGYQCEELPNSITKLHNLQVLVLSGLLVRHLPHDFSKLVKLSHLNLARCRELRELPHDFSKLLKLPRLDLAGCGELEQLPHDFGKLVKLTRLNLANCKKLRQLPHDFSELVKLTHLNVNNCGELRQLPNDFGKLVKLTHLNLTNCGELKQWPHDFCELEELCHLVVDGCHQELIGMPLGLDRLKQLGALTSVVGRIVIKIGENYKNVEVMKDMSGEYLSKIPGLKEVHIEMKGECTKPEAALEMLEPHPNLKVLFLEGYGGMTIPWWRSAPIQLFNLVYIYIDGCDNLVTLPSFSKLPFLKTLRNSDLKNLEYMETRSNLLEASDTAFFPSLETIHIFECKKWRGWFKGRRVRGC